MIFDNQLVANNAISRAAMNTQYKELGKHRSFNLKKDALGEDFQQLFGNAMKEVFGLNAGSKPGQLFQEWDNQIVSEFRLDEGDVILNDLLPLSRMLPFGRTVLKNARSSDSGEFQQSMMGEHESYYDAIDYDTDGTLVPVGSNGFKRNKREADQMSLEDFADLNELRAQNVRTHRQGVIGSFMDGHRNKQGQLISEGGLTWAGVRADSRVDQVDLGGSGLNIDFTSATGPAIKSKFIELCRIRAVDNKVAEPATFYVSTSIYFHLMDDYSTAYEGKSILAQLLTIPGVAAIKMTSVLTGNQVLSMPLTSRYIQPLVGMAVSIIPLARPEWNSPLAFDIVSAIGWNVKTDFGSSNRAVQYASS